MNAYLILRDICPAQDRYRAYASGSASVWMQGQEHYSVVLTWGRAGYLKPSMAKEEINHSAVWHR